MSPFSHVYNGMINLTPESAFEEDVKKIHTDVWHIVGDEKSPFALPVFERSFHARKAIWLTSVGIEMGIRPKPQTVLAMEPWLVGFSCLGSELTPLQGLSKCTSPRAASDPLWGEGRCLVLTQHRTQASSFRHALSTKHLEVSPQLPLAVKWRWLWGPAGRMCVHMHVHTRAHI